MSKGLDKKDEKEVKMKASMGLPFLVRGSFCLYCSFYTLKSHLYNFDYECCGDLASLWL